MLHLSGDGADAEFAVGDEIDLALKPSGLDFPDAAAIPIGALTAYQALFDAAELQAILAPTSGSLITTTKKAD